MTEKDMPYGDDAIRNGSGKTWAEWREVLDAWGAPEKTHTEIARYVANDLGVDEWWAQGVTVGYERLIGRREVGQRLDGSYSASVSKTIAADQADVFAWVADDDKRAKWLPETAARFRTASEPRSVRLDDLDHGIIISFSIYPTPAGKTSCQVQADKLPSKEFGDEWKAAWKPRLADLAKAITR